MHAILSRTLRTVVATTIAVAFAWAPASQAKVTRIIVDSTIPLTGQDIAYEQVIGRAFGELDPNDHHNKLITDLANAPRVNGKVHYVASFMIVKPVNLSLASGLMWHDVPNRGGR